MEYRRIGTNGPQVSALSLGSWNTYGRLSFEDSVRLIGHAFELGITTFDVSYYRDQPHTEVLFGRILDEVGKSRNDYRLIEKLWFFDYPQRSLEEQFAQSLVRLGRDRTDIILCEHIRPGMQADKIAEEVAELVMSGKAGAWGAMNWSMADIRRAYEHTSRLGLPRPQLAELKYNIARSGVVDGEAFQKLCADTGITLIASDVMEGGILAGKIEPARKIGIDTGSIRAEIKALLPRLEDIAAEYRATLAQLALAFALAGRATSSVLFGATRITQLEENVGALRLAREHGVQLRAALSALRVAGHVEEAPYEFNVALTSAFVSATA
jgi:aryl-alcohol dehydrogenase-like predicted oxidoreductase